MKGFVVGCGRSGTKWSATALAECSSLNARHESMHHRLGADFGGVEVNGNFWGTVPTIRERFPEATVLHQVRDGRDVVRSIMSHKGPDWPFSRSCDRWMVRNREIMEAIPATHRFRLEDLVADFDDFAAMAFLLKASSTSREAWDRIRTKRVNSYPHKFPAYRDWTERQREIFWDICGEMMGAMGYER